MKFYLFIFCLAFYSCFQINWGNHFTFEIDLSNKVDSLGFKYCNELQIFKSYYDDSLNVNNITFEGNIDPYHEIKPCDISFLIYSESETIQIDGGVFSCFNCDGSHYYLINKDTVIYKLHQ